MPPVILIIRDGWGINPHGPLQAELDGDATVLAHTPFHDHLLAAYPHGRLSASGLDVGLPDGQMGNSEVGHLNLGAGRIVYQDLTRIDKAIAEGRLADNPVIKDAFAKACAQPGRRLHFLGLVSDGGVHSHLDHLVALVQDRPCRRGAGNPDPRLHRRPGHLADRRRRVPRRTRRRARAPARGSSRSSAGISPWTATTAGNAPSSPGTPSSAARAPSARSIPPTPCRPLYDGGTTDEFLPPMIFPPPAAGEPRVRNDGDVVFFFNFRSDRAKQLSAAFLDEDFVGFERTHWPRVHYVTLTQYDASYDCPHVFPPQTLEKILGQVVSEAGKRQLRIAETEKYPHVTYFFNGGVETPFPARTGASSRRPRWPRTISSRR